MTEKHVVQVTNLVEHEDGSATITMELTNEVAKIIYEMGFLALLENSIEGTEDE